MSNLEGFSKRGMELGDNSEGIKEGPFISSLSENFDNLDSFSEDLDNLEIEFYVHNLISALLSLEVTPDEAKVRDYLMSVCMSISRSKQFGSYFDTNFIINFVAAQRLSDSDAKTKLLEVCEFLRLSEGQKIDYIDQRRDNNFGTR